MVAIIILSNSLFCSFLNGVQCCNKVENQDKQALAVGGLKSENLMAELMHVMMPSMQDALIQHILD